MPATIKTAVSVPKEVFAQADSLAKELHMSRSGLVTMALKALIQNFEAKRMQAKIDAAFADYPTAGDRHTQALTEEAMLDIWEQEDEEW